MRLGYFTMPMHPQHRSPTETLQEDRDAIILADKLGFYDAFVGEHLTENTENITSSMLFLATLISDTRNIKLATGTSNLSQWHPVMIASHAAMFDHLAKGRFIFGISAGALRCDAEALGTINENRQKMFEDCIEVILEIWKRDTPYDIDIPGNRYKVTTATQRELSIGRGHLYKPYQQPRPEIVGTVVAPFSKGVIEMGKKDFHPLSANFLLAKWLPSHWQNYTKGKQEVGQTPDLNDWRVARTIFVADDDATARRYAIEDSASPYRFYWQQMYTKMKLGGRDAVFKNAREQPDSEITEDYILDNLVIHGTPSKVADEILKLREEAGDFGEIVYAGMDYVDPRLARRSMELMATEVMPRVNAAIGKPGQKAAVAA
ncbi:MAG TPA: LLM class flavin-dependent oxidoreductase [Burkholderiales bacterium]|nr:LLM class flavin-dependent oxidoreductase [Burkholderiales bacterium]